MPRSLAHLPMTPRNTGSCSAPAHWLGSATKPVDYLPHLNKLDSGSVRRIMRDNALELMS